MDKLDYTNKDDDIWIHYVDQGKPVYSCYCKSCRYEEKVVGDLIVPIINLLNRYGCPQCGNKQ